MTSIDDIFASLPDELAQDAHEFLVIDPATRTITVPDAEKIFGVEGDADAERKYFICPRYVGNNLDLASMFLTVNYRNANGQEDGYLVEDVAVNGDYVTFSWEIWPNVVAYKGTVQFAVCADLPNSSTSRGPDWNTTLSQGTVLTGMDPDRGDLEEGTSDVLTQLRSEVSRQTSAVQVTGVQQVQAVEDAAAAATTTAQAQIEAKGAATLATIPDDYTTLANKANEHANAIKGSMFGQVVRADDMSPVEHYPAISVRSKNLFLAMDAGSSHTMAGVTFTWNDDGSVTLQGTATDNSNFGIGEVYLETGTYCLCDFAEGAFPDDTQARVQVYSYTSGLAISTRNNSASDFVAGASSVLTASWHQCRIRIEAGHAYDCTLRPVMLKNEHPTEYIPYVSDLAAVTVKRHGKNLFNATPTTIDGVTLSRQGDYFVLNGTATASNNFVTYIGHLPAGKYTLSANNPANNGIEWSLVDVYSNDPYCILAVKDNANNGKATADLKESSYLCRIRIESGATYNNFVIKPQLELGETATAYEAYKEPVTAMPAADGTLTGLPSVGPSMTLITDTENVTVDCEYNRDSNAVYAELLAKIAALSGTT